MADLVVDGSGLADLHGKLNSSADDMNEATSALSHAGTGQLGSGDLEGAGDHFASEWGYGIGQIHKASTNVAKQLQAGISSYDQADAKLAEQIRKALTKS